MPLRGESGTFQPGNSAQSLFLNGAAIKWTFQQQCVSTKPNIRGVTPIGAEMSNRRLQPGICQRRTQLKHPQTWEAPYCISFFLIFPDDQIDSVGIMSLRRQSCNACFRERRKCDLTYPVCARCKSRNKGCIYVYPPTPPPWKSQSQEPGQAGRFSRAVVRSKVDPRRAAPPSVPRQLGSLGRLQPLSPLPGYAELAWIYDLLRDSPSTFAAHGETVFIHKALFQGGRVPSPLLTAFGISAGCTSLNESNRDILFQALDTQMNHLLFTTPTGGTASTSALDNLARFQAIVLYQIIRLFYGDVNQRVAAERQAYAVRAQALRLLQSIDSTLSDTDMADSDTPGSTSVETIMQTGSAQSWEKWILSESIRRTVFVAFKLYTVYTAFRYGRCVETEALAMLPVSTRPARAWYSREFYDDWRHSRLVAREDTTTVGAFAFTTGMGMFGSAELEVFEQFVLSAACKG